MDDLGHNFDEVADEFADIPATIRETLDSMDEMIRNLDSQFEEGQVEEVDSVVESYSAFRTNLETFDEDINRILSYLRGSTTPNSVDDIDSIERSTETLIESVNEFSTRCGELATVFADLGFNELTNALDTVSESMNGFPGALETSIFQTRLPTALKAHYFPEALTDELPSIVADTASENPQTKQNAYFILAALAEEFPTDIEPYWDDIAQNAATASPEVHQNMLAAMAFIAADERVTQPIATDEALEYLDSDRTAVAIYAALVLGAQSTTDQQARLIGERIRSLLGEADGHDLQLNVTSVLCDLAESHPSVGDQLVSRVGGFLESEYPDVQRNTIEFLATMESPKYRDQIRRIADSAPDENLKETAERALEQIPAESSEAESANPVDSRDPDSILDEIENEFGDL